MAPQHTIYPHFDFMKFQSAMSIPSQDPVGAMDQSINDLSGSSFETQVADGASDVPSSKRPSGNWKASALIFGCEACERLGFYAISSNLVGYLTTMLGEDTSAAVRNANNWSGTVRLTPLLGAIVADSYLGRFVTIGIFMCVYLLAQIAVTASVTLPSLKPQECEMGAGAASCTPATRMQVAFFYSALYAMALGAGGVRACVFPFAADQFDAAHPAEARRRLSCANWWFVAITSGTVAAVGFLVYAQAALGWAWGYGLPAAVTAAWTLVYFLGAPLYCNLGTVLGSPLTRVAQVLVCAARNWRAMVPVDAALLHEIPAAQYTTGQLMRPHTRSFTFLDKAAILDQPDKHPDPWKVSTVTQVEEVKTLARLLPIWLTNIAFWVVYAQVTTLFLNQGTTLDRRIGTFCIPAASMPLFLHLAICAFLPAYDALLVPLAQRVTGNPRGLTTLQRIGVGQAISILPIAIAAVVENHRLKISRTHATPLPMSIFWLLPQYALFGVAEVFLSVGQVEFFTDEAPETMRSLGNAMVSCAIAVGSFGSSVLVGVVTRATRGAGGGWIGDDVNRSHVDYFFWLLTGLSVVNLAVYVGVAHRYGGGIDGAGDGMVDQAGSVKRVHPVNVVGAGFRSGFGDQSAMETTIL